MRNRHLAAIPLAALLLTACASATDTAPLTTPTPEPTATATPTPAAGDFAWLNRLESSFNSGDAYYEMVYRNHGGLLLKTDYATAAQTADGRWLFWTESNDENAHLAYGLIAPNDFAAGSTDYTPVEMWAG